MQILHTQTRTLTGLRSQRRAATSSSLLTPTAYRSLCVQRQAEGRSLLPARPTQPLRSCRLCALADTDRNGVSSPQADIRGFDSIEAALKDLAAGKFVVVLDNEDRENEGDLIIAADRVTTEAMHFLVEYTSGVVCISMEGKDLDRLRIPLMVQSAENDESMYTAFTVTVDLKKGTTTGISASDRAKTIRALADPLSVPADFRRPGHIFPLRYREGGVLVRPGHTEAAVDLARLAGCYPAGVLCEIVNKADGSMARTPQLLEFSKQHNLKCITIDDLAKYLQKREVVVQQSTSGQTSTFTPSLLNGHVLSPAAR